MLGNEIVAGFVVVAALAVMAWLLRVATVVGALTGAVLAAVVFLGLSWPGLAVVWTFVAAAALATRFRFRSKLAAGIAQTGGGRRGGRHAFANLGIASLGAALVATSPKIAPELAPEIATAATTAAVAAIAVALADTLGSELGPVVGGSGAFGRTVSIRDLSIVAPGTDGGISLLGTIAGAGGALLIAVVASALGAIAVDAIMVVIVAGVVGSAVDSLLGATLEARGMLENEGVNLVATASGAMLAGATILLG